MAFGSVPNWVTDSPAERRRHQAYHSRRMHEGRVPQPGIPEGPRNNPLDALDHTINVPPVAGLPAGPIVPGALVHLGLPESPQLALSLAASKGIQPPAALEHAAIGGWSPDTFEAIQKAAMDKLASQEGIHADPLAEAAINIAATAGLGAGASLLRGGAEAALGAAAGSEASSAPSIAESLVNAAKTARGLPAAARNAPAAARSAVEELATSAGRRAAAARAGGALAGQALEHPKTTQTALLGGVGAVTPGHAGGLQIPSALVQGSLAALDPFAGDSFGEHPINTLEATGRGLAGAVTAPAALLYAAADSATHGNPDAFLNTAGGQLHGLEAIAGNLLSGDPARVQKATEEEAGLSLLPLLPRLRDTALADAAVSRIRSGAKDLRGRANERFNTDLRYGPGEQNVFGFTERRQARRSVAEEGQALTAPDNLRGARHAHDIEKGARKLPDARSMRNLQGLQGGDILQAIADYGLNHADQIKLLREKGPKRNPDSTAGDVTLHAVLDHLERNPELLGSPRVQELARTYAESAKTTPLAIAGADARASRLSQAALFGIRDAVDRVPHGARKFTKAEDRAGAWKELSESERRAKELRHEARVSLTEATARELAGHGAIARKLRENARGLYSESRALEARNKDFRKELAPYTRPEHAVSSRARRKLWDEALVKEMVDEVDAAAGQHGLDPGIWTHHGELRSEGQKGAGPRGGNIRATGVQHVRRSPSDPVSLAARDSVDRGLTAFLQGSIEGPRRKAGLQKFARNFFSTRHIPLQVKVGDKSVTKGRMTYEQFSQAIKDGQISKRDHIWVPESEYKQPFSAKGAALEPAQKQLADEIAADAHHPGAKGVVVRKEDWEEYQAQTNPTRYIGEQFVNAVSKGAGRVLLFSPAWVASQAIAELLPDVMAHPRLLADPTYLAKIHREVKGAAAIDKEAAMGYAAAMGEAPVRSASARELTPGYQPTHSMFFNAARAIEHTPVGRALFSTARLRPLVVFDQWRQGKYRQLLGAAELDKQLNGFFGGLQGMLRNQHKLSDELKGQPLRKAIVEIERNPRYRSLLDENRRYVEDIAGNWTAFTRYERRFAPFAVFYGFLRYAFRWPFAFAKRHPLTAELNYFLAQQNAEQVEKLLHGKPTDFYQFANPVVQGNDGKSQWLPGGSRIAPGLSAISQGALGGDLAQSAVGSLNPLYAAAVAAVTGTNDFGQHEDDDPTFLGLHLSLAAKELMTTPPLLRLAGVGESHSDTAEQLHANDPNRKLRSFAAPWLPQSGKGARDNAEIIRSIQQYDEEKAANGGYPPSSGSSSSNPLDALDSQLGGGSNPLDQLDKALSP